MDEMRHYKTSVCFAKRVKKDGTYSIDAQEGKGMREKKTEQNKTERFNFWLCFQWIFNKTFFAEKYSVPTKKINTQTNDHFCKRKKVLLNGFCFHFKHVRCRCRCIRINCVRRRLPLIFLFLFRVSNDLVGFLCCCVMCLIFFLSPF